MERNPILGKGKENFCIFAKMKEIILGILSFLFSISLGGSGKEMIASYYNDKFIGKETANGTTFRQDKLLAATNLYPLGTYLLLRNTRGRSIIVQVVDRINPRYNHRIDLSKRAFSHLGNLEDGLIKIEVISLGDSA